MKNRLKLDKNVVVDVLMPTYNHENFIAQAIESVLMQKCSFSYRLIIGDDCSTDRTVDICEEFANYNEDKILLLKNSSNVGMAANYKHLFNVSTAEYISILEGDDYWSDIEKLQKQVEILESNSGIGLVHSNYYALYENGKKKKGHVGENVDSNSGEVIGPSQTVSININPLTICFRANLAKENVDFDFIIENRLLTIDILLLAEICRRANVFFIDEVTGVYRIHESAITGSSNINSIEKFSKTSLMLVNYLMEKYDTPARVKDTVLSQNKLYLINHYLLAKQYQKARSELHNVKVVVTLKEKVTYLSAKYRSLVFLVHLMALIYHLGSIIKQFFSNQIDKDKNA